jgi:dual specificity tyrosine-phosphorylation-regulated kinase 2/3/4
LLHLKENDPEDTNNIIRIKDYCMFRKHLIISFELFSINLYEFIRNNNFEGVSLSLIRRFAIQILQALKYLREESLIHCDLKPENILLKSPDKSGIKVIDFGSSCFAHERIYTYIQSRFYRAPEIILGIPYTTAIDMWSFGCILTELFTGVPLFPGESEQEQLSLIMEVIGLPSRDILAQASRKSVFFDEQTNEPYLSRDSQGNLRIPSSKPLDEVLMCQSDSFHDFITKCLEWDPEKRITPFDALMHEWIIEGLPDQVLIHHKKMLGIYESETEANTALNNQSHSLLDTSVQDADNIADVSGLHGAASPS